MAAHHVDHRRAAALERHVQHVDAGLQLEQLAAEVLEAADAGRGVLQLARLLLGERDQLLDRIHRQAGMDGDHVGPAGENRDRGERLERIVGQLVEPGIDGMRHRDDQDGVAVLRRAGGKLGADHAAGAGAVVDHDLLAQVSRSSWVPIMRPTTSLLPPGGNGMISRTGLFGIILRGDRRGQRQQQAGGREQLECDFDMLGPSRRLPGGQILGLAVGLHHCISWPGTAMLPGCLRHNVLVKRAFQEPSGRSATASAATPALAASFCNAAISAPLYGMPLRRRASS